MIQNATTEIKKLILDYALYLKSKLELRDRIKAIIKLVAKRLPTDLIDRDKYIMGLYRASERMITLYYDTQVSRFYNTIALLTLLGFAEAQKIKNGIELSKVVEENKSYIIKAFHNRDLKYVAKGYPNVIDYDRELKKTIKEMSNFEVVSDEAGKKPISLFQKAEIDLRHEKQMDMIQDLKDSGIQYAWTSSHVDCSKRCEPWQGKLFDIQAESSELSGHRMSKKLDGHTVYCLKEVISKVDKYGYTNNILVGFNCRHKLIAYTGEIKADTYTKEEIEKEREINANMRSMERHIRQMKQELELAKINKDTELVKKLKRRIEVATQKYFDYCEKNGFATLVYRLG